MLAYAIARKENIEVDDTEVDEYIKEQNLSESDWQNAKDNLVLNEVKEFVISNVK
jgi:hypothetical protein